MTPAELVDPDPRWRNFVGDRGALAAHAATWRVSDSVPDGVADVLRVSRDLFIHSYFVYEFVLTAVIWGLLALEAGLRDCLDAESRESLHDLIVRAEGQGLFTAEEAAALDAGRQLRNRIVHGHLLPTFAPGVGAQMLQATHDAISDLYDRASSAPIQDPAETP